MNGHDDSTFVFIGTQGQGANQGIHAAIIDEATGDMRLIGVAAVVDRPTWVICDPQRPVLYAVSEMGNAGDRLGDVLSFAIGTPEAPLRLLGSICSGGGGPTHTAVSPGALFIANYGGGQVAVAPIAQDGTLQPVTSVLTGSGSGPHRRQRGPHAHGVTLDPSGRFLLAPDMGADRIFVYAYDAASQTLEEDARRHVVTPAGAGPRLLLFGKDGRFAYLLTELSAQIFIYHWDEQAGLLEALDPPALNPVALDPPGFDSSRSAAGFAMSRDGRFLYATNRRTHELHVFAIAADGGLTSVQTIAAGGEKPWAVEIAPSGRWLFVAAQASDLITVFSLDAVTGRLSPGPEALAVPQPTSFTFARASKPIA